ILAAGKGVRMRSSKPKVMHELCGRPMVLWPVQAALEAGAGSIVVVDSPERTLQAVLPDGVELAVQERADGAGGAGAAALSHLERPAPDGPPVSPVPDPRAPVLVLSGDVPLVSAGAIGSLIEAHGASGAAATVAVCTLDDPDGYGRVVRDSSGAVERVVETKELGDSTAEERQIREGNAGIYGFGRDGPRGA